MTVSQGQTTYNLEMVIAYPGQLADLENNVIESYPCAASVTVTPGQAVILASDGVSCTPASATMGSSSQVITGLLGVAVLQDARQAPDGSGVVGTGAGNGISGAAYGPGDIVPVLRRGKIFASVYCSGSTAMPQMTGTGLHLNQSSTIVTNQGTFTTDATSATAGAEISPVPAGIVSKPPALPVSGGLVLLEVNLPSVQ